MVTNLKALLKKLNHEIEFTYYKKQQFYLWKRTNGSDCIFSTALGADVTIDISEELAKQLKKLLPNIKNIKVEDVSNLYKATDRNNKLNKIV